MFFKGLRLLFFPNVPGATLIPESRVALFELNKAIWQDFLHFCDFFPITFYKTLSWDKEMHLINAIHFFLNSTSTLTVLLTYLSIKLKKQDWKAKGIGKTKVSTNFFN